jgi:hypothetical protein
MCTSAVDSSIGVFFAYVAAFFAFAAAVFAFVAASPSSVTFFAVASSAHFCSNNLLNCFLAFLLFYFSILALAASLC